MKFKLKTLLLATTLIVICISIVNSHRNSINQVQAIEKKVESILEETILEMKSVWVAEFEEQIGAAPSFKDEVPEEAIHVFRGTESVTEDLRTNCFASPSRRRTIGGLFKGRTLLARDWSMWMRSPAAYLSELSGAKSEGEWKTASLWVEHQVPWRLWAAQPETTFSHGIGATENDRFLEMLTKRLDQAGIKYKVTD